MRTRYIKMQRTTPQLPFSFLHCPTKALLPTQQPTRLALLSVTSHPPSLGAQRNHHLRNRKTGRSSRPKPRFGLSGEAAAQLFVRSAAAKEGDKGRKRTNSRAVLSPGVRPVPAAQASIVLVRWVPPRSRVIELRSSLRGMST